MNSKDLLTSRVLSNNDAEIVSATDLVRGLYRGFLNREVDKAGLLYWTTAIESGANIQAVIQGILGSPEYGTQSDAIRSIENIKRAVAKYARSFLADRPIMIVDVGAQELHGEEHVYAAIEKFNIPKKIIGFEPLDVRRAERVQHESSQDIELLSTFVGDGEQHTFHINNPDSTSSLLPFNDKIIREFVGLSGLATEKTEMVTTQTLDESLVNYSYIDFLKLDIQGFELPALLHSTNVLKRTQIVHCEVSFVEIYRSQALFSEIETFLRGLGFNFIDFSFSCRYPYHNTSNIQTNDRLGWADAVFFRENSSSSNQRDLIVQSLIALLVYEKSSLSASLANCCNSDFLSLFNDTPVFDAEI